MANYSNHHRKVEKVWDSRPITEVPREELAIAEARRYGWGFVIVDQMPLLLSRYVWDNMGTVIVHRLTNVDSWEVVKRSIGSSPLRCVERGYDELVLKLPEDLAFYRNYLGDPMTGASNVGTVTIPKVK